MSSAGVPQIQSHPTPFMWDGKFGIMTEDLKAISTENNRVLMRDRGLPASGTLEDIASWWKFEEIENDDLRVDSINGYNLTPSIIEGTLGGVPGHVNTALAMTGGNVNVQGTYEGLNYLDTGMTLFGWLQQENSFSTILIDFELVFLGAANDRFRIQFSTPASGSNCTVTLSENVSGTPTVTVPVLYTPGSGDYIFVRAWHNGPGGFLRLQVNNGSVAESATQWTPFATPTHGRIFFYGNGVRYFDEWGFIRRAITDDEASFLYNDGAGRTWPFS